MNFFSDDQNNIDFHDLISGQADPITVKRLNERGSIDPVFAAKVEEFAFIRRNMKALPTIPTPRSFRLTPKMTGVKPPKPRVFTWLSYAASLTSLVFVLSTGMRLVNAPVLSTKTDIAMESAPAMLEAPMEAPLMAHAMEAPVDAPEVAAFADMPEEGSAPEDLALQAAPVEALPDAAARKLPEEMPGAIVQDNALSPMPSSPSASEMIFWISLVLSLLLFSGMFFGRMIQVRVWRSNWKF